MDRVFDAIVPRAVGAVDPDELLDRIDLDQLVERLDIERLMARIDVDALIQRVDVDAIVQRVDVDAIVQRVDVDAIIRRVDIDAILAEVDIRGIVARAGIDQAIAETATGLAGRTLSLVQRRLHRLDALLLGAIDRVLGRRRDVDRRPAALGGLAPAGPFARLLGFVVDTVVVSTTFSLGVLLATSLLELFTSRTFDVRDDGGPGWALAFLAWWFTYLWACIGLGGRTVGKGLVGIRVVGADLAPAPARAALVRAVAFPFSFVLGLGFLPALLGRRRRALHDLVAGTQELVDADAVAPSAAP